MNSFYAYLGIEQSSSPAEIEAALQRRSQEINPSGSGESDLHGPARSQWRVLQAARAVLSDAAKRSAYDATLAPPAAATSRPAAHPVFTARSNQAAPGAQPGRPVSASAQQKSSSRSCSTCGTPADGPQPFCLVCGSELGASKANSAAYAGQLTQDHHLQPGPSVGSFMLAVFKVIGWRKVRGTIVTAEAPYGVDNEFILWKFLLKIGVFLFLASMIYDWVSKNMFAVFLGGALILLLAVFSAGIFCMIFGQLLGALFSAKLFGKEKQIQVRDVRLRDSHLQEHVVRFRGELRAGQVAVGDEIEIWGKNRGGTIMARWGYNFRTRTRISVKYR